MKIGKLIVVGVMAVLMLGSLCPSVEAATSWYTCDVVMTGPGFDRVYIKLTDAAASPAFIAKWAWAGTDVTIANRMLATVLTAINSGKQVLVRFDAAVSYPVIQALYIVQ